MDRKKFIVSTSLAAVGAFFVSKISGVDGKSGNWKQNETSGLIGVEGVFSPTNRHMVGNGFKVMNFYPNGKGFEERMSPFFLLDFNAEVDFPPSEISCCFPNSQPISY